MSKRSLKNNVFRQSLNEYYQIFEDNEDLMDYSLQEYQEPQHDESSDRLFDDKNSYVLDKETRYKSPSKIPHPNQDSNSLGYLTKQFIRLVRQTKPNQCVDINDAARKLNVQKRRIYDITNVLEGTGFIEKVGKNLMRWVGGTKDDMKSEMIEVDQRIQELQQYERQLDAKIEAMNKKIGQLNEFQNYYTLADFSQIRQSLGCDHIIVYNGCKGAEIISTQNPQTQQKQIIIENPSSKKIGRIFLISESKHDTKLLYDIHTMTDDEKSEEGNLKFEEKSEEKIKFEEDRDSAKRSQRNEFEDIYNDVDVREQQENQEKSSTFEDHDKFLLKANPKEKKQPGLKVQQQAVKRSAMRQKEEGTRETGKKRGRSIPGKIQTGKGEDKSKQPSMRSSSQERKSKKSDLYFDSDSKEYSKVDSWKELL